MSNRNILSLLGLALRGGNLVVGEEPVEGVARARDARVLLVASDAAENTVRRVRHFAEAGQCLWLKLPFTKDELGGAVGRTSVAIVAVTDIGLANAVVHKLAEEDPKRYGEAAKRLEIKAQRAAERRAEQQAHEKNIRTGKVAKKKKAAAAEEEKNAAVRKDDEKQERTQQDRALSSVTDAAYETVAAPEASWKSASLLLKDAVNVRLKFAAHNIEGLSVVVQLGDQRFTIGQEAFIATETAGTYYVVFDQLDASQLSDTFYATIYRGDQKVSNTLRYSVESYAYAKQNDADAGLQGLVRAIIRYGDAASTYVNSSK